MKNQGFRFAAFCWMLPASLLVTCDSFHEEENLLRVNTSATHYYVLPNSSTVVDLHGILSASFTDVSVRVSQYPRRGTLTSLNEFLLKYTPSPSFTTAVEYTDGPGKDQFKVLFATDEKILGTRAITVNMTRYLGHFPCALYAIEDLAQTTPGTTVLIQFLFNDRLCGIKVNGVDASISVNAKHGQVTINNDTIIYTPETDFEGTDEIVYRISAPNNQQISGNNNLLVSYGLVKIDVRQ